MTFPNENKLLGDAQSGFRLFVSYECQLLNIYKSVDYIRPLEVRGIFLDIFKAFDRVWHYRLI